MPIAAAAAASAAKRAAGGRVGGPAPYGWRWAGSDLAPVEEEQHVVWLVHLLHHRRGMTLAQIADHLAELDLRPRSGDRWRRDAVHRLLSRDLARTG